MTSSLKPIPSLVVSLVAKFLVDNLRHNLRRQIALRLGKASSPLRFGVFPDDALDVAPRIATHVLFDLAARGPQRGRVNRVEEATDKIIIWEAPFEKAGKEARNELHWFPQTQRHH